MADPFLATKDNYCMKERFLGEIIKQRRQELGITQAELCEGICEPPTLSRIENKKQTPTRNVLNALLQRLGISDDRFYAALTAEELRINELCKEITSNNVNYEKAVACKKGDIRKETLELHNELRKLMDPNDKDLEQFIVRSRVLLGGENGNYSPDEKIKLLTDALKLTHQSFNADNIETGLFTFDEIKMINQIAMAYSEKGDSEYAISIWEKLLSNINIRFEQIVPSRTSKELVLYAIAREYLIIGDYKKALVHAREGQDIAVSYGIYRHLPGNTIIMAECEHQLGNDARGKELFTEALYLARVIVDKSNEVVASDALKEYYDIDL